jgi:hypothetical protein
MQKGPISRLLVEVNWPDPFNECFGLWLLKNSLVVNPQELHRVRMPYKRLSRIVWTFSIPRFVLIFGDAEFFNTHACSCHLRRKVQIARHSGVRGIVRRII